MLIQVIHPSKTAFSFPYATIFGTVNHVALPDVYRVVVSVEICSTAEAALATGKDAGEPGAGSEREENDVNPLFLHLLDIAN